MADYLGIPCQQNLGFIREDVSMENVEADDFDALGISAF